MPEFEHDQIRFHYRDEGQGLPFIFQHGLGADVSQPFSLFRPPRGIRLIAFDARGHGQTHPMGDEAKLGFETFASDLGALIRHLELSRAVLGGISMGAGIALRFGLDHPELPLALVLSRPAWLAAPCSYNIRMFTLITDLLRKYGARAGQVRFKQTPEYLETARLWPDAAKSFANQFESPGVEASAVKYERIIHDCPNRDRAQWKSIRVPTLILANRQDPVHPFEYGETLAREIPGAALREITSKSVSVDQHMVDVQRELEQFLRSHFKLEE